MLKYRIILPLLVVAIVALIGIIFTTRWGIGLLPDSASYVGAARQLQAGEGLSLPAADGGAAPYLYFAPLYPVLLAVGSLGNDPMQGSLWVNAILMGGSVFLSGVVVYRGTRSVGAAVVGAMLVGAAPDMLRAHSLALSESPFIFFCVLTWVLVAEYLERPHFWVLLAVSVTTGLAFLARYSGAGLVAANGLALLLLSRKGIAGRVVDGVVMGAMSSALSLAFMMQQGGGAGGRSVAFHPIPPEKIVGGIFTVARWFVPEGVLRWIVEGMARGELLAFGVMVFVGMGFGVVAAGVVSGVRYIGREVGVKAWLAGMPKVVWVLLIFCVTYFVFIIFTISFIDAFNWLEPRIMLPSHIALTLALVCMVWALLVQIPRQRWQYQVVAAGAGVLLVSYVAQGVIQTAEDYSSGVGFRGAYWRNSQALEYIAGIGEDATIYSNNPEVIYLYTGRMTWRLPFVYDFTSLEPNPELEAEIGMMREVMASSEVYILYFSDQVRPHLIAPDDLVTRLKLRQLDVPVDDAVVYTPQVAPVSLS